MVLCCAMALGLSGLAASPALAGGAGLLFESSPEFLWTELDLLQNGRTMPTSVFPLTRQEFHERIVREEAPMSPSSENRFVFSLHPFYTTFDSPYSHLVTSTVYLYDRIPPTAIIGDEFSIGDRVNVRLTIDLSPPESMLAGQGSYGFWEIMKITNMEFPRESYGVVSIPHADLAVGRMKTGIGYGYFGNTFLNSKATYYDQIQMSYYNRHFKFFYMLGTSSTYLTAREHDIQSSDTNWDPLNVSDRTKFDEPVKLFAYHRVEAHPWDRVTFGFGELNMIGGKTPELAHVNPFGFWHNTYTSGYSNVLFSMDASVVPFRGLHLFGEMSIDDIRATISESPDSKPTSLAWQVGARYVLPFSDAVKHVVGAEFTHVDPWTYNRWQPYLIMYQRQILNGGHQYVDIPLGYAFGGDLNHYGGYYQAVNKEGLRLEVSYDHLDKGPIELGMIDSGGIPIYYDHPGWSGITTGPWGHGIVEQRDTVAVSLSLPLPYGLELLTSGQYTWIDNFGHQDGVRETLSIFQVGLRWNY